FDDLLRLFRQRPFAAGDDRHACLYHRIFCTYLVTHQPNGVWARTDKDKPAFFHAFREISVLRQEAVARVNCFGIRNLGGTDDGRNIEIAIRRGRWTDTDRFVGQPHIFGLCIGHGMHGNRLDPEFPAGALHTEGNFTSIRNEYFFKHGRSAKAVRRLDALSGPGTLLPDEEQWLAVFDRLPVFDQDFLDDTRLVGFYLVQ